MICVLIEGSKGVDRSQGGALKPFWGGAGGYTVLVAVDEGLKGEKELVS